MEHGIDVHGAKGVVQFDKVRSSGRSFAFVKATEGKSFVDRRVASNVRAANEAGLLVGCYHFARPDTGNSADAEANHFIEVVRSLPFTLAPVLDIERGTGDLSRWALRFLQVVQNDLGVRPVLYTYSGFAHRLPWGALGEYPLWLANYRATAPGAPRPWSRWHVWQHTSSGHVPGVPGNCDENVASPEDLRLITIRPQEDDLTQAEHDLLVQTHMLATAALDTAARVEQAVLRLEEAAKKK